MHDKVHQAGITERVALVTGANQGIGLDGARLPVHHALRGADAVSGRFVEASGETPW